METLTSQRRVSFSDSGQQKRDPTIKPRDGIPQKKTRSFKEDKKESKKLQWYFSNQMNEDYDSKNIEFATAVASAAFAIRSKEETDLQYQKKKRESMEASITKVKSRKDDTAAFAPRITRPLSKKETQTTNPGQSSIKRPMEQEKRESVTGIPKPPAPPRRSLIPSRADVWERNKMERISKRYLKIKASILAWENEKKMHAKLHMEKKKDELERKKALFQQYYHENIARIDQIAGGARAHLEEKRKREEKKARETANRIRSTGRLPVTCFCFQYH
ncbi:remorin [Cucumis melo]|uniref:Remorin n=1 Tax=Cucumis melo TaxID=3656 RepID=A0A1S3BHL8_CUCME|nr:remorin [Cucumis melo]